MGMPASWWLRGQDRELWVEVDGPGVAKGICIVMERFLACSSRRALTQEGSLGDGVGTRAGKPGRSAGPVG